MNNESKTKIKALLQAFCERAGSQNKAANMLKGVSGPNIHNILNDKWQSISDAYWRLVGSQVGFETSTWSMVETTNFTQISELLNDAQTNNEVYAVVGEAGCGKSKTCEYYAENNKRVYLLECSEYWNRKGFMEDLLTAMGERFEGLTVPDMVKLAVRSLKSQQSPLIILDEADKLIDSVLYFFITLYNKTEDHAGIVMIATDHLEKRITRGVKLNRKGYKEIYSRIGRKFIRLKDAKNADITGICHENGVSDIAKVSEIINESKGDLRRVKRMIHKYKLTNPVNTLEEVA